ncbi:MAG: hypothetical protein RLZZ450_1783 [Pseudomonadota bacterium]|jgi:hypothetical protein
MARFLPLLVCLLVALTTAAPKANAQTDARDYEGAGGAPNNTLILLNYLRHQSTIDRRNLITNSSSFRASWVLKFGHLAVVPIDLFFSVADVDLRVPAAPGSAVSSASIRTTGFSDLQYLPSIIYDVVEDKEINTHTYFGANLYTIMPIGTYRPNAPINISENRWGIKPQVAVGQRFAKAFTLDLIGNLTIFTDNTEFVVPGRAAAGGMPAVPPSRQTLKQDPTWGGEAHLAVDVDPTTYLALSYYATNVGKRSLAIGREVEPPASVQTLRFTWGWRIEKQMLLLVQLQQDVAATGEASKNRFWGMRLSRFFY